MQNINLKDELFYSVSLKIIVRFFLLFQVHLSLYKRVK